MESDDSPGSPRKKLRLEGSTSIDVKIDLLNATEDMSGIERDPVPMPSKKDNTLSTDGQQNFIDTSKSEDLPITNVSKDLAEPDRMTTTAAPSPLDQISKESASGITEFVNSSAPGFSGVLKKRYTDFLVNEILPSGEVVHLTSLRAPKKEKPIEEAKRQSAQESRREEQASKSSHTPQNESKKMAVVNETVLEPSTAQLSLPSAARVDETEEIQRERARIEEPKQVDTKQQETKQEETGLEEIKHEEAALPHEGALLPHLATEPKKGSSPKPSPAKETRSRQQFYLHHTSEGWAEYDKEKFDKEKTMTANGNVTTNKDTEQEPALTTPRKADVLLQEEQPAASTMDQPQEDNSLDISPQAKWQAYADPNGESPTAHKISDEDRATLLSYFSEPVVDAIRSLYNRILNSTRRPTRDYGTVKSDTMDRGLRAKIHQDMRRIFQSRLETMTDNDGAIIVSAMPPTANNYNSRAAVSHNKRGEAASRGSHHSSRGQFGNSGRPNWQELGGDFLHFTLYKENKDTMESISWLAKNLKLGPRAFEFAGTKDRRAVTVQRVSVYRQAVNRLIDAGRSLRQSYIGNYEYRPQALQLGELAGNEFTITLRDCTFGDLMSAVTSIGEAHTIVDSAVTKLVKQGFINYFGLQRFGTFSTSTDNVGVKLLQGDFKSAVEAILHFDPESLAASANPTSADDRISRDDKARLHAIHAFQTTGKAQGALADLPRKFSAEAAIIRHLGNKGAQAHDYLGAIQSIQRNLRLMYVHAYQSLVWNMAASKRWSLHGNSVVEGDLVLVNEDMDHAKPVSKGEDVDEDGEVVVKPAADDRATNIEDLFTRARPLSKAEAESGNYTIFDIVLPTPGFDIIYPSNEMEEFYKDFMASPRGGGLDPYDMRRPQRDFSLSGSYRKVLAKPGKDISFEIKTYTNDDEQFVETDMDRLNKARDESQSMMRGNANEDSADAQLDSGRGQAEKETVGGVPGVDENIKADSDEDVDGDGDGDGGVSLRKIAVVLKIQLGASQYATMALRELMKDGGVRTYKADFGGGR